MNTHMKKCKACVDHLEGASQNVLVSSGGHTSDCGGRGVVMTKPFDQTVCKQATVKMIILDELLLSFFENDGFTHFVRWLSLSSLFLREELLLGMLLVYTKLKERHCRLFLVEIDKPSFLVEMDYVTTLNYMVIISHFIDLDWRLHRRIISFSPILDLKGKTIANQFIKDLEEWGIDKVFSITLDNASDNDKAIKVLKDTLNNRNNDALVMNDEFMHIHCCAHTLHLIANEGLDDISKSIISVQNVVKYVRSSNSRLVISEFLGSSFTKSQTCLTTDI